MHTESFERRVMKILAIRTCANRFKRFKNGDFDINNKERSGRSAVVEELQKNGKKWKMMENTSINLYCIFLL